jgi:hypothetical protein
MHLSRLWCIQAISRPMTQLSETLRSDTNNHEKWFSRSSDWPSTREPAEILLKLSLETEPPDASPMIHHSHHITSIDMLRSNDGEAIHVAPVNNSPASVLKIPHGHSFFSNPESAHSWVIARNFENSRSQPSETFIPHPPLISTLCDLTIFPHRHTVNQGHTRLMKEHLLVQMQRRSTLKPEVEISASTTQVQYHHSCWLRRNFRW